MPSTTPTVDDVARLARVSTATVSRALNSPQTVSPPLRERVQSAVARLGYVPHAGARALSLRRSGTVGVVVPTIDNAIFARGLQAFQRRMVAADHHVLLAFSNYSPAQEHAQVNNLLARGVDALALTGLSQRPALLAQLSQRGLPFIHCGSFPAPAGRACVGFRNRVVIQQAVQYLLDLGHQHIAMLAGITANNDRASERVRGVRLALERNGLTLPPQLVEQAAYDLESARAATAKLLQQRPMPSALLCGNDVLAWGALLQAQAAGLAVPAQLSIIGFDDLDLSRHLAPALTTMHVPTERMWELAADHLLARLNGSATQAAQYEVQVELVVRGSTAAAKGRGTRRGFGV